ncbi:GNAT family N-acetyltransferase [Candidatus Bathyarchaeota archaeon]|nr:MAG: GNAT family N-acetyltransferase [Candidatus Bathyarchaeota archaeon]
MTRGSCLKVRTRRLTSNDYRAVKNIERIIVNEYLQYLKETGDKDSIERWITPQYFNHYVGTETSFVAETDGKLVGFILAQPTSYIQGAKREIWLEYIAVLPETRKKGIGSRLISKAVNHARSHGVKLLYTTLNPNNSGSSRLLVKHGFEVKDWKQAKRELEK